MTGVLILAAAVLALAAPPACAVELKTVMHMHSHFSHTGELSLPQLVEKAAARGVDVLIPTDTFIATYEYGLWPLRGLVRKRVEQNSVLHVGIERYLQALDAAERSRPGMVVVPAVEVAPYYRWSGSPWSGLILEDWHRHLLILGLKTAADYAAIPALGNTTGADWSAWPIVLMVLLFCAAGAMAALELRAGARPSIETCVLALLGALVFANGWPFARWQRSPYDGGTDWSPYQRVIDYAQGRGALSVWAHPDAPNWESPVTVAPRVQVRTAPYPDAVVRTAHFHGFGYFSEGWRRAGVPGGEWDKKLGMYVTGARGLPCWAFAEVDYHHPTDGPIDGTYMSVDAKERTREAVLEALKAGRFYSVAAGSMPGLRLKRWELSAGGRSAGAGETLSGPRTPRVDVELSSEGREAAKAEITLVRGGRVVTRQSVSLPGRWSFLDDGNTDARTYYRIAVKDERSRELVSNPIFLTP